MEMLLLFAFVGFIPSSESLFWAVVTRQILDKKFLVGSIDWLPVLNGGAGKSCRAEPWFCPAGWDWVWKTWSVPLALDWLRTKNWEFCLNCDWDVTALRACWLGFKFVICEASPSPLGILGVAMLKHCCEVGKVGKDVQPDGIFMTLEEGPMLLLFGCLRRSCGTGCWGNGMFWRKRDWTLSL